MKTVVHNNTNATIVLPEVFNSFPLPANGTKDFLYSVISDADTKKLVKLATKTPSTPQNVNFPHSSIDFPGDAGLGILAGLPITPILTYVINEQEPVGVPRGTRVYSITDNAPRVLQNDEVWVSEGRDYWALTDGLQINSGFYGQYCALNNGGALSCGGLPDFSFTSISDQANVYDEKTRSYYAVPAMPTPTAFAMAAASAQKKAVVIGGVSSFDVPDLAVDPQSNLIHEIRIFDTETETWSIGPAIPGGSGTVTLAYANGSNLNAGMKLTGAPGSFKPQWVNEFIFLSGATNANNNGAWLIGSINGPGSEAVVVCDGAGVAMTSARTAVPESGVAWAVKGTCATSGDPHAVALKNGKILFFGGGKGKTWAAYAAPSDGVRAEDLSLRSYLYDPVSNTAEETGPLLAGVKYNTTPVVLSNGKVVTFGGAPYDQYPPHGDSQDLENAGVHNKTQIFNPATKTWSLGAPMPVIPGEDDGDATALAGRRKNASAAIIKGNIVLVAGGMTTHGVNDYAPRTSAIIYDADADTWRQTDSMQLTQQYGTLINVGGGQILMVAGNDETLWVNTVTPMFDTNTETWTFADPAPEGEDGFGNPIGGQQAFYDSNAPLLLKNGTIVVPSGISNLDFFSASFESPLYTPGKPKKDNVRKIISLTAPEEARRLAHLNKMKGR